MKRIVCIALAALLLVSMFTGCQKAEDDWKYISDKGKLVIGYTDYEPMNYMDENGNLTGFDTEFAEAVCAKLGLTPEFVLINWDTKVMEINAKSIDCIWNGMTITDELKDSIAISDPYVKNMQVLVIKSENAELYTDTASLVGKTIVAEAGSAGEKAVAGEENLAQANLITLSTQKDTLMEVKAGTADAAIIDWTMAQAMTGEGTDYADLQMIAGVELSTEEYGIGFRQGSTACAKVNEAIKALVEDGTLPALAEKYELSLAPAIAG